MSDIVERLRNNDGLGVDAADYKLMQEAADRIERLRSLLYRCQVAWIEDDSDLAAEVRAALEGK